MQIASLNANLIMPYSVAMSCCKYLYMFLDVSDRASESLPSAMPLLPMLKGDFEDRILLASAIVLLGFGLDAGLTI